MAMQRTTLKMIAQAAGVTTTTVSYVLNDNPKQNISAETRERVLKTAKDLCYVPNIAAKSLRNQRSMCIAVAIEKDLTFSRFAQTLQGIRMYLEQKGYSVMLCTFQRRKDFYVDYINKFLEKRVDGIIYMARDNLPIDHETEDIINQYKIPFVAFDCQVKEAGYCTVDFDYYTNAFEVTQKLLEHCSQRLVYLRPEVKNAQEEQREVGVRAAMDSATDKKLQISYWSISEEMLDDFSFTLKTPEQQLSGAPRMEKALYHDLIRLPSQIADGDTVLSSWGPLVPVIKSALAEKKIFWGSLADIPYAANIPGIYTHLPNEEAGKRCAELLMNQVEKKPTRSCLMELSYRMIRATSQNPLEQK